MHLCLGSFVRVLNLCAYGRGNLGKTCEVVLLSVSEDGKQLSSEDAKGRPISYNASNFAKINSSDQDLNDKLRERVLKADPAVLNAYFQENVAPLLDDGKKELAVCILREIILNDPLIDDNAEIGCLQGIKKNDLKDKTSFDLSEFLVDAFVHAVKTNDNTVDKPFTMSIKKGFEDPYLETAKVISIYKATSPKVKASELTTAHGSFDQLFFEASADSLGISPPNHCKVYCLRFIDMNFDYDALWDHLLLNVGYYLFSRAEIADFESKNAVATISARAIKMLKEYTGATDVEELSRLLLYVFLEQALGAPKLMNQIELTTHGCAIPSTSSGLHLLLRDASIPCDQLVMGASMIDGDLRIAIDRAFDDVDELKTKKGDVRRFVESSVFSNYFSDDVAKQLAEILVPKKATQPKPETAYGMLVGYTLKGVSKSGLSIPQYRAQVKARLKEDLSREKPYIEQKIKERGLEGTSLYLYLIPFHDAGSDSAAIMKKLVS